MAPRHPIVSIERRPFPAITPSPNYAYSIPIETSNDNLRTTFDQLFKLQFENESKQLDREVMETVPGALPKNPRIRRRKLLFGSDLEETEVEGNIATIAAEAATNAASLEEDDEVFVRRQRTLGAPPRDDIDSRRNLQIPSETDAEVSITSTNTSPMEGRTRARNYNLRRRTIVERATRPVSRPAIDPESTIQIDSDDDQVYRPAYGIRSFFRRHSIRTRSQRLLGESSSSNSQDEASDDDEMQASTLYTNTYSRRERGYLPYVPQIYDTVTYIREGHECFLESISLENHPDYHQSDRAQSARRSARISSTAVDVRRNGYLPWQHFPNLPPIVHGQVVNISYIPGLIGDEMAAWCVLDIMICPENMIFEGMPPITSENKSNLIRVTFTDMQGVADFVVPYCMYSWSVARLQIFTPGEVVRVIFADESSEATVVKTPEPANMISQRPWNCYGVRFLEGEDTGEELFSPWDLQPIINGSGGSVDRRSYECLESLENRVSHLIEAKVAKVCGTNRYAPFVDPVSLNDFPDYPETVAYPISLTIIRDRLQAKYYRRIESLEWDVRMIQTNTAAYNQPDSQIVQNAADLVQILLTYISRITCDRNGEQSSPNSLERRTTGDDINYGLTSLRREGALMTRDGSTDEQPSSFSNHLSRRSLRSRTLHSVEENSLGVDREVQRSRLARHLIGEVVPTSNFSESYNDEVELFSGSRTSEFGRSSSFQSRRSNQNSSIDYVNRNLQNDYGNTDYTRSNRITNDDRNNRRLDRFQRPRTCETRYQEIESDEEMEQDDPEEEVHRRPRRSVSRRAIFPESDDDFEDYSSMRRRRTNNHYSRRSDQDSSPTVMSRSRRHSGRQ